MSIYQIASSMVPILLRALKLDNNDSDPTGAQFARVKKVYNCVSDLEEELGFNLLANETNGKFCFDFASLKSM